MSRQDDRHRLHALIKQTNDKIEDLQKENRKRQRKLDALDRLDRQDRRAAVARLVENAGLLNIDDGLLEKLLLAEAERLRATQAARPSVEACGAPGASAPPRGSLPPSLQEGRGEFSPAGEPGKHQ